jgi:hypothetical protein
MDGTRRWSDRQTRDKQPLAFAGTARMSMITASDRLGRGGFALRFAVISVVLWGALSQGISIFHGNPLAAILVPVGIAGSGSLV